MNRHGYFGVGIYHGKAEVNIGTLWRSAHILGANFIFTIGKRYKSQASDTTKALRHVPLFEHDTLEEFYSNLPYGCRLVAVELANNATPLARFPHPQQAAYLLGAEDHGLPASVLAKCHHTVVIPGEYCLNVAVAGSIVLYDRLVKAEAIRSEHLQQKLACARTVKL